MTKQADFKRRVRERMAKTGESYTAARGAAARATGRRRDAARDQRRLDARTSLLQTALVERVVVWRDVLHEGPVPDVGDAELRAVRARFLGATRGRRRVRGARRARSRPAATASTCCGSRPTSTTSCRSPRSSPGSRALRVPAERITLICIGEYLGIAHFGGLGELRPDQLEGLPAAAAVDADRRRARARHPRVGGAARARPARPARRSWRRARPSCASCPRPSTASAASTRGRATACRSPSAGCSPRSPRAPRRAGEAFVRGAAREARPFLGDTWAFAAIERLARAEVPLLAASAGAVDRHTPVALTDAGPPRARRRRRPRRAQRHRPLDRRACTWWGAMCRGAGTRGSRRSWPPRALDGAARRQLHHRGEGVSGGRGAGGRPRGRGAPNCPGLRPETGTNPGSSPEDDRGRPRPGTLPPLDAAVCAAQRRKRSAEDRREPQSSSSTQSIARVTALRHLR